MCASECCDRTVILRISKYGLPISHLLPSRGCGDRAFAGGVNIPGSPYPKHHQHLPDQTAFAGGAAAAGESGRQTQT